MKDQSMHNMEFDHDSETPHFRRLMIVMAAIEKLGLDERTAARYARLIGNKPVVDEEGNVLVVERGQVLAKLKLSLPHES